MSAHDPSKPVSALALFRYAVVSEVRASVARGHVRAEAVRQTAQQLHLGLDGVPRRVGKRTIYRWLAAYDDRGLPGLEDQPRTTGTDGVLEPALVAFLLDQKRADPRASVPELLRRAAVAGLIRHPTDIDRTTAWRALRRRAVDTRRKPRVRDQRRFAYAHRLQLVLCDGKHFRAGPTGAKRVALFFLDDATRYVPEVVVGTSESAELFLRGLHRLLRAVGHIDAIYLDHGSGFIAHDTRQVTAQLDIAHVLGTERYPQARGKVERFNQTAQEDLLRHLHAPGVDPDCTALELRIGHYLRADYNLRGHSSLNDVSPREAFCADPRPLTPYTDDQALQRAFFVGETRRVSRDHVVSIGGRQWEVPRGLAEQKITVQRSVFDPLDLQLWHEARWLRLSEVDPVANARAKRRGAPAEEPSTPTTAKGAALTAADAELSPITHPDGGYAVPDEET